nr:MAG TPA: hypothetical protein [Caudoviricetes sp.]
MNKLRAILRLLFSKEYHLIIVERSSPILIEQVYSTLRETETTYKKLIEGLKDLLEELRRRRKYEQGRFD